MRHYFDSTGVFSCDKNRYISKKQDSVMKEQTDAPLLLEAMIGDALAEDIQNGDITCEALGIQIHAAAKIVSKGFGILSGNSIAKKVFQTLNSELNVVLHKKDKDILQPGDIVLTVEGDAASILSAERTALNFLGHMSGISTLTQSFMKEIAHTNCKILDTRKTTPLLRNLDKYAVSCGGGTNHRAGLWDMILIKENHIRAAGGINNALNAVMNWKKKHALHIKTEIEVTTREEFNQACTYPIDMIMLDHFSIDDMRECVKMCPGHIRLEASGNITLNSVREIAETGVHYISSGALTHSASHFDFSLLFDPLK